MKHKFKMIKLENEKIAEVSPFLFSTKNTLNDESKFAAFFMIVALIITPLCNTSDQLYII
jgi:hypothetical protein